jgi:hypothetical protein
MRQSLDSLYFPPYLYNRASLRQLSVMHCGETPVNLHR